jgi:hypothetical protein
MNSDFLYLRELDSIDVPAQGDSIFILSVETRRSSGSAVSDVVVQGLSFGSATGSVKVILKSGVLTNAVNVTPATRHFTSSFASVSLTGESWLQVEAQNADGGATGKDALVLAVPAPATLDLGAAPLANLETARFDFLAGTPDRIVNTHFFTQLVLEPLGVFAAQDDAVYRHPDPTLMIYRGPDEKIYALDILKLIEDTRPLVIDRWKTFALGKSPYAEFLREATATLRQQMPKYRRQAQPAERKEWEKHFAKKAAAGERSPRVDQGKVVTDKSGSVVYSGAGGVALQQKTLQYLLAHDDFGGKVGLLFADRLRFQPSGLVVGEPLYTLSLAPGEEVQLRQVVETKRRATAEEVTNREQELTRNLSSTWSNDISEGVSQQSSVQDAVTVGINANAKLPIEALPVGVGANVSNSTTVADTTSREYTVKTSVETTATATSRMRAQHKIRLEVTSEVGSSLAATRTIRNANAQRAATYIFSKVYRKERVTLERHDAQLCFRLVVNDPAAQARANFLSNLDKIDPNSPQHYPNAPLAQTAEKSLEFTWLDGNVFWNEFYSAYTSYQEVDLRDGMTVVGGGSIPLGNVLSNFRLRLVDFDLFNREGTPISIIREEIVRSSSKSEFDAAGGDFRWNPRPSLGGTTAKGTIRVSLPYRWSDWFVYWRDSVMSRVQLKLQADWVPTQGDVIAYQAAVQEIRAALLAACTEARVLQLRDIASADYSGQVVASAVSQQLSPTENIVFLRHIFNFESAFIENAPYWASQSGLATYRALERRLRDLPIPLSLSEVLVPELITPQAVVYLPVFSGHEGEALDLLPGVSADEKARLMDDIRAFRREHFPVLPTTLPTSQEVLSPTPPSGTPAGAKEWETRWEKPQRGFDVLAHWHILTPTDGVHMETRLSDSVVTDEHQTRMLENQTDG